MKNNRIYILFLAIGFCFTLFIQDSDSKETYRIKFFDFRIITDMKTKIKTATDIIAKYILDFLKFDSEADAELLYSLGDNNRGVINGPIWVNGKMTEALRFDGTDDVKEIFEGKFANGQITIEKKAVTTETVEYIFNGNMELAEVGMISPGFYMLNFLDTDVAYKYPEKSYIPIAAPGGVEGNCMKVPGVSGRLDYNLETERFRIEREGKLELSFYAKAGPDENGGYRNMRVVIDFRAYYDDSDMTGYPLLESASFTPTQKWKQYKFIFNTKEGLNHKIMFRGRTSSKNDLINTLYFDNISLKYSDQKKIYHNEAYISLNKEIMAYEVDETVNLKIKALLKSKNDVEQVILSIFNDHNNRIALKDTVKLKYTKKIITESGETLSLYEGNYSTNVGRYGAFSSKIEYKDENVISKGGDFVIIHPVVDHPRFSPGWSLGIGGGSRIHTFPSIFGNAPALKVDNCRIDTFYKFIRLAGLKIVRFWGHWKLTEEIEGKYTNNIVENEVKLIKKNKLETLYILGGKMNATKNLAILPKNRIKGAQSTWLYTKYLKNLRKDRIWGVVPPVDKWEKYVEYMVKNFKNDIKFWEVINEPQWAMTADDYMLLLKSSYKVIKKYDPSALVIGNGATSDGVSPLKWVEALSKLDHEKYLDAVAYHPYGAGLDSQNGVANFKATKRVRDIRDRLKKNKPLWCTENYYLVSATVKQGKGGWEKTVFGAEDIQRHQLLLLMNNVVVGASLGYTSLMEAGRCIRTPLDPIPNVVFAGCNALSYFLKDMKKLKKVNIDEYIKTGVFYNADKTEGIGFIWALKADMPGLEIPKKYLKKNLIKYYDIFGNEVIPASVLQLSFDPIYLKGKPEFIEEILKNYDLCLKN